MTLQLCKEMLQHLQGWCWLGINSQVLPSGLKEEFGETWDLRNHAIIQFLFFLNHGSTKVLFFFQVQNECMYFFWNYTAFKNKSRNFQHVYVPLGWQTDYIYTSITMFISCFVFMLTFIWLKYSWINRQNGSSRIPKIVAFPQWFTHSKVKRG